MNQYRNIVRESLKLNKNLITDLTVIKGLGAITDNDGSAHDWNLVDYTTSGSWQIVLAMKDLMTTAANKGIVTFSFDPADANAGKLFVKVDYATGPSSFSSLILHTVDFSAFINRSVVVNGTATTVNKFFNPQSTDLTIGGVTYKADQLRHKLLVDLEASLEAMFALMDTLSSI